MMIYNTFDKDNSSIGLKTATIKFINYFSLREFPYNMNIHEKINYKSFMFENKLID